MIEIQLKNGTVVRTRKAIDAGNGIIKIDNGLEVVDNNIVRHSGTNRLPSSRATTFQTRIDEIIQNGFSLPEDWYEKYGSKILEVPRLEKQNTMFSKDDQVLLDCWNDGSRRYFESLLAQKIINHFLQQEVSGLAAISSEIKDFLISEYETHNPKLLKIWKSIVEGHQNSEITNPNLKSFASFRNNLLALLKSNDIKNDNFLLELYDLHYLTHALATFRSYKEKHPYGTVKSYLEYSSYYMSKNRGRICGFGFNEGSPSANLGIMRSIDPVPYDMRIPSTPSENQSDITRCPDRLYMRRPDRKNKSSWMNQALSNPLNSAYVNGLSGSTLLEINAILFYFASLDNTDSTSLAENNFQALKDYWLMMGSIFVYIEGGHTFTEIMSVFELEGVKSSLKEVLAPFCASSSQNVPKFNLETIFFDNPEITSLYKEALIETAHYQSVQQNKKRVHESLRIKKIETEIAAIIKQFKLDIDAYEFSNDRYKEILTTFHSELLKLKEEAFKNPTNKSFLEFSKKLTNYIEGIKPELKKNDSPFLNILIRIVQTIKQILNKLIYGATLGRAESFFSIKEPDPVENTGINLVESLSENINHS